MKRILLLILAISLSLSACAPARVLSTPTPTPTFLPYQTPGWFKNAVLYEIFVRSFYDSNGDGIGDLRGVEEKLDYIQSLGATAIWLMPIYPSPSDHGYDVTDYFAVNPSYGTLDDLKSLITAAHNRGIRLLLDFVPSHLSNQNPIFKDAYGNPNSKYSDWFVWTNTGHTQYASFSGNETMPRFNHYNPAVVDYLCRAALFWLKIGADGFRIDNATFPPQEFFYTLRQRVKAAHPDALLLGETWENNPSDLGRFFDNQFDALFDFPLNQTLLGDQTSNNVGILAGKSYPVLLTTLLDEEKKFTAEAMTVRFLGNHDTNRIATKLGGDPSRLRMAAALLASLPGPIMIYYGDEIGMPGQKGGPPYWDNYRREPMDWYAAESGPGQTTWFKPADDWNKSNDGISVEEEQKDPNSLLNYYRMVIRDRKNFPAFEGQVEFVELNTSKPSAWALWWHNGFANMLALYNFSNDSVTVTIPNFPFDVPLSALRNILAGQDYPAPQPSQPYTIAISAASCLWLQASP